MPSVLIHRYIKGADGHKAARKHLGYIHHRPGREKDPRYCFDGNRDSVGVTEIQDRLAGLPATGVIIHKLMFSPGQKTDIKGYVREIMARLQIRRGQDFHWYAVEHNHTDHQHAHVVVLGVDHKGRPVRFSKSDHTLARQTGDRYLQRQKRRQRQFERRLQDKERWQSRHYSRRFADDWISGDETHPKPRRFVCSLSKRTLTAKYHSKVSGRNKPTPRESGKEFVHWLERPSAIAQEQRKELERSLALTIKEIEQRQRDYLEQLWDR